MALTAERLTSLGKKHFQNPWKLYEYFLYNLFFTSHGFTQQLPKVNYTRKMNLLTSFGFILAINFAPWFLNVGDPFLILNILNGVYIYMRHFQILPGTSHDYFWVYVGLGFPAAAGYL